MKTVVTILQLLCGLAIILIVLFQSGKSQGLSGTIGGIADSYMAKSKAKSLDAKLAKATAHDSQYTRFYHNTTGNARGLPGFFVLFPGKMIEQMLQSKRRCGTI